MEESWQSRKNVLQCNKYMLLNKVSCDVTFLLGSGKVEVSAHKYVLISRSPVFYAMFCGNLAENEKRICLPDIEPKIFELFLRYLYYEDTTVVDGESVMHLMYTAKKYSVVGLEDICKLFLKANISTENVCLVLEQSHSFDDKELQQECLGYVWQYAEEVLPSEGFLNLCSNCMKTVIAADQLKADEKTVYEVAMKWAERQCMTKKLENNDQNQREVLGKILYEIRFPLLPLSYFADNVSKSNVLTQSEKLNIYEYLCQSERPDITSVAQFSSRYRIKRNLSFCRRFKTTVESSDWVQKGKKDAVTFLCSQPIWMHGVSLYGSRDTGAPYDIDIKLVGESNKEFARHGCTQFSKMNESMFNVLFHRPVKLAVNVPYTIIVTMVGPKSYYGEKGRRRVHCNSVMFEFMSSPQSSNSTNVFTGQIPGIIYSPWL